MLDTFVLAMQDADDYVGYLHSLSDMGAAMREVVAKALINPQIYRELTHCMSTLSISWIMDTQQA